MSDTTKIAWANSTWNPWIGCRAVSPGCQNCYARTLVNGRMGRDFSTRRRTAPATFNAPLKWSKKPWVCGCGECISDKLSFGDDHYHKTCRPMAYRRRVFLGSLMDWLDPEVPVEWLADALQVIRESSGLDFLCLTKRPEQFTIRLQAVRAREQYTKLGLWADEWLRGKAPANVWFGVSVEDQQRADDRIPELLRIPAAMRFLSVEPLLGKVELSGVAAGMKMPFNHPSYRPVFKRNRAEDGTVFDTAHKIVKPDWVIVGGETSPNRRDCGVEAIVSIHDQCQAAGVPCFVKQDCAAKPGQQGRIPDNVWTCKEFPLALACR